MNMYFKEDHHPAIIDRKKWKLAQTLLNARHHAKTVTSNPHNTNVGFKNRNLFEPILQCIDVTIRTGQHLKVTGFWVAENKTLCFDLIEFVLEEWKGRHNN